MSTPSILDDAEQRITSATTQARTAQAEIIESMREEIGRPHYQQAKEKLPELERVIAKVHRPFFDRVANIQARTKAPLPDSARVWLQEMLTICDTVPNTIRAGIEGWDRLTPPIWTDGRSIDVMGRAKLVHDIRFCLRNWDDHFGRLKNLQAQVEGYIRDSGWPSGQPGPVTLATAPQRGSAGVTVET